jgi:hypothetical protein
MGGKNDPRIKTCFCGKPASRGYGYQGTRRLLPAKMQGVLWVCTDHIDDAELRWRSANAGPAARGADTPAGGAGLQPKPKTGGRIHTAADDTRQGALLI